MMTPEEMAAVAQKYVTQQMESNVFNRAAPHRYEVLFDSWAQPAEAMLRGSVTASRQLLFRIGAIFIDVEVGREADSNSASLVGQILDSSKPGEPPSGVPIALLVRGRRIASTSTNDHGEFRFQFVVKQDLKLSVELERNKSVYLPIIGSPKPRAGADAKKCVAVGGAENRALAQ